MSAINGTLDQEAPPWLYAPPRARVSRGHFIHSQLAYNAAVRLEVTGMVRKSHIVHFGTAEPRCDSR